MKIKSYKLMNMTAKSAKQNQSEVQRDLNKIELWWNIINIILRISKLLNRKWGTIKHGFYDIANIYM